MSNPQKVKFHSVEDFLAFLPKHELQIVSYLRELVKDCIPQAKEKLAFNVPFYYRHAQICCIWPASVPWGNLKEGVALGFSKGHLLPDDTDYLLKEERKKVTRKIFTSLDEIEDDMLRAFLFEAVALDEAHRK